MATKEKLEEMATDLFKRLGGNRTRDGRIVRALLLQWKSAELGAAEAEARRQLKGANYTQVTVTEVTDLGPVGPAS